MVRVKQVIVYVTKQENTVLSIKGLCQDRKKKTLKRESYFTCLAKIRFVGSRCSGILGGWNMKNEASL